MALKSITDQELDRPYAEKYSLLPMNDDEDNIKTLINLLVKKGARATSELTDLGKKINPVVHPLKFIERTLQSDLISKVVSMVNGWWPSYIIFGKQLQRSLKKEHKKAQENLSHYLSDFAEVIHIKSRSSDLEDCVERGDFSEFVKIVYLAERDR